MDRVRDGGVKVGAEAELETPHFILNTERLRVALRSFQVAFPGSSVYYAMKANPHREVVRTLLDEGCGMEVASWGEIELLRSLRASPDNIIYGSAVKPAGHVERAVEFGVSRFAADSVEELEMLARIAPGSHVIVRAHVDDSQSVFRLNEKFGAPVETLRGLAHHARDAGLSV